MRTTEAETHLEVWVHCPYCDRFQNKVDELKHHFDYGELSALECEVEIECEKCKEVFIVEQIHY